MKKGILGFIFGILVSIVSVLVALGALVSKLFENKCMKEELADSVAKSFKNLIYVALYGTKPYSTYKPKPYSTYKPKTINYSDFDRDHSLNYAAKKAHDISMLYFYSKESIESKRKNILKEAEKEGRITVEKVIDILNADVISSKYIDSKFGWTYEEALEAFVIRELNNTDTWYFSLSSHFPHVLDYVSKGEEDDTDD